MQKLLTNSFFLLFLFAPILGLNAQHLALNKPVTASSEADGTVSSSLTDGSLSTRWSSAYNDDEWIYVDLGEVLDIGRVVLNWETAFGSAYLIEVSDDATSWTPVYRTDVGDGGTDHILLNTSGRYVRMSGITRGTTYGYSIWEMEVYGLNSPPADGCDNADGVVVREKWTGFGNEWGTASIPLFATPNSTSELMSLETPVDEESNYGVRIRGYIVPAVSDTYTFYLASDDNSELYLSSSDDPADAVQIANINGYTLPEEWDKYDTQQASPVELVACTKYYFEVRHRDNGAGNNLSVGWTGADYNDITVISGTYLSSFEEGSDPSLGPIDSLPCPNDIGNPDIFAQNDLLKYGINMSGMEAPDENWSSPLCENDFKRARDVGVKSFRLPIRWDSDQHMEQSPPFKINDSWFERVDEVLGWAKEYGESVIINVHHFDRLTQSPDIYDEMFFAIWRQIAERYKCEPSNVFFELLNEPKDRFNSDPASERLNQLHADVLPIIRLTNPHRSILVGAKWSGYIGGITDLILPEDDRDLIYTGHYYSPLSFTHQGAWWCCEEFLPGTPWGTQAEMNSVTGDLNTPTQWAADPLTGEGVRPLHLGEFGALGTQQNGETAAPPESRVAYVEHIVNFCLEYGLSWSHWEWKGNYGVYDENTNVFESDLVAAILASEYTPDGLDEDRIPCDSFDSGPPNSIRSSFGEASASNLRTYPNPAYGSATIEFTLAEASKVTLQVLDARGRVVRSILKDSNLASSTHTVGFDPEELDRGVYFVQLTTRGISTTQKMIVN